MNKRTRLKLSIASMIFLASLATLATFKYREGLGMSCIAGFMAVGSFYLWGETKRPSSI